MWWWIMGCFAAAGLALASIRLHRRRAERVRLDRIRATVDRSLSATLKQPDGHVQPPTVTVRRRHRVGLGDPRLLGSILFSGWRMR